MRGKPRTARGVAPLAMAAAALAVAMALAIPALAQSGRDGDRSGDRDPAGTIVAFDRDSGKLTIDLADGGTIAGFVTRWTWIDDDDHCGDDSRHLTDWCRRSLHGDDRDGWDRDRGDTDDLVAGAVVEDALLVLKDGRAFFAKIELDD